MDEQLPPTSSQQEGPLCTLFPSYLGIVGSKGLSLLGARQTGGWGASGSVDIRGLPGLFLAKKIEDSNHPEYEISLSK
jgi:hypothetical protein